MFLIKNEQVFIAKNFKKISESQNGKGFMLAGTKKGAGLAILHKYDCINQMAAVFHD